MLANAAGALAALLLAAGAYLRSHARGGFYDAEVYGMTPAVHRRYAAAGALFVALFLLAALVPAFGIATIWLWTAFVLFAVFYGSSYLRGAHEDDE